MPRNSASLDSLLASKNYREVCPDTVTRVWEECLRRHRTPAEAEHAARKALHGITGAFMGPREARKLAEDIQSWTSDPCDAALERMLGRHASTRERLPLARMDALFERIFDITGRPRSVLDLACGIAPLYLGARGVDTTGVDLFRGAVDAVNRFHEVCGAPVRAVWSDLLCPGSLPEGHFDLALLFKLLPLLERQKSGAAMNVMRAIDSGWVAVSFPSRTLSGRNVGMADHYPAWMQAHTPAGWRAEATFETANEIFFVFRQEAAHA